jgi:hypothetical protein
MMAEPKLQIDKRVEELEEQVKRHELAIGTMAQWLVQAQTGFGAHDAAGIEKILRGETSEKEEDLST